MWIEQKQYTLNYSPSYRILFVEMDEIHSLARKLVDGFESPGKGLPSARNLLNLFAKCDARIKRYRVRIPSLYQVRLISTEVLMQVSFTDEHVGIPPHFE